MPDHYGYVRPADATEAARYRELRHDPVLHSYLQAGAKDAHETFVPGLKAGHFGITERSMEAGVRRRLQAAFASPCRAGLSALTDDEQFMYRLGFEAVATPAKDEALAAVGLGTALFLGAVIASAARPPLPTHRRLRPEDFGALPQGGRSASMPWAERVRRVVDHPSRGVGRIHGTGEPPQADV